jgi:D-3-phosphoglycerate dehydrogenase
VSQPGRPVVLIADKLAPSTVEALGDGVEVRWVDGPDRPALLAAVPEADAILVRSATTVDAEVLAAGTKLKIIGRAGVGLDNVEIPDLQHPLGSRARSCSAHVDRSPDSRSRQDTA